MYKIEQNFIIHIIVQLKQRYSFVLVIQNIHKMMKVKQYLSGWDLFTALPTLRAQGESDVSNACGGLISLVLLGFFVYIFIMNIIATIRLQSIVSTQTTNHLTDQHIKNVKVSLGLQFMNLLQMRNMFELKAYIMDETFQNFEIKVFPCTRDYWSALDDNQYKSLNLYGHMCVDSQSIDLFGDTGASDFSALYITLTICDNATSPVPCASTVDINNFFAANMIMGRFLASSLIFLDSDISPTQKNPITYTSYQKTYWLIFTQQQYMMNQVYLGTYSIQTDTSFLPWTTIEKKEGYYVSQAILSTVVNNNHNILTQTFVFASSNNIEISRTFGKIDGALSYVGGLFGLLFAFLAYFLMSFNKYKYELRVSEGAFTFKNNHLATEQSFHFGKYLKYVAFDWIKTVFRCEPDWEDCKAIDEARSQANEQIDVKHLLLRISHLQQVINLLQNPYSQTAVYLAESHTLEEVKRRRNIVEYCNLFIGGTKGLTIDSYDQLDAVISFATRFNSEGSMNNLNLLESQIRNQKETSLDLMQRFVQKYVQNYNITQQSFQVTEEYIKTQQQLVNAFYNIDQETRSKIIKKIPLAILYRLQKYGKNIQNPHRTRHNTQQKIIPLSKLVAKESASRGYLNNKLNNKSGSHHNNMDNTLQLSN